MRARRKRRRLFNLLAFVILAFAIYLVAFKKEDPWTQSSGQTVHAMNVESTASVRVAH
jgi:hypothetical protein